MAFTTNTQSNSNGVVNFARGYMVADAGAAAVLTVTLGFIPRTVRFHNLTDRISFEWFEGMAPASALQTIAAGTRTLELANGVTVVGQSFSLPAASVPASKTFAWEAIM